MTKAIGDAMSEAATGCIMNGGRKTILCVICAANVAAKAIAARDAERDRHDQNWMGRHDDAQANHSHRMNEVRQVINGLAYECPSHHMTGVDPMCDSCSAKNEENPYWPALTAIIEAMRTP